MSKTNLKISKIRMVELAEININIKVLIKGKVQLLWENKDKVSIKVHNKQIETVFMTFQT